MSKKRDMVVWSSMTARHDEGTYKQTGATGKE